jgi:Reverse transcriptase (RNA-dependent DNA polymerase)
MLVEYPYVFIIANDFTKAFATVEHAILVDKLATLLLPHNACNCLIDFFTQQTHCTAYGKGKSSNHEITASIIQGSAIGPAAYIVTTADLQTPTPGNAMCKNTNNAYIIIPASNVDSPDAKLHNVECQ